VVPQFCCISAIYKVVGSCRKIPTRVPVYLIRESPEVYKVYMLTQILLNSIISALLLSMVAIGFNLIFNATKVFHLAHGAMYVSAVYATFMFNNLLRLVLPQAASIVASVILSLLLISVLIVIVEYLIYRPLYRKNVNPTISMISSLGVYLLVVNVIAFFFGNESVSLNNNYRIVTSNAYFKLTDVELIHLTVSVVLISVVLLLSRTRFYTHIRAVTDNYSVAEKFGINVQQTRFVALIAGTVLVGAVGIMRAHEVAIDPHVGLTITLAASVAVIVGGVNSLAGTIVACFVIALIENFSVKVLTAQWKDMLTYTLMIAVLIFYQQGLISVKQRVEAR
jgi:branched-chain amino acid transport system permease protein